jgi:hypothetical protein
VATDATVVQQAARDCLQDVRRIDHGEQRGECSLGSQAADCLDVGLQDVVSAQQQADAKDTEARFTGIGNVGMRGSFLRAETSSADVKFAITCGASYLRVCGVKKTPALTRGRPYKNAEPLRTKRRGVPKCPLGIVDWKYRDRYPLGTYDLGEWQENADVNAANSVPICKHFRFGWLCANATS